jgi:hypothetical protein
MTTLKTLLAAAALAATCLPAAAQVPLGYTIFNSSSQPVAVGMPRPEYRSTDIHWLDGRRGSTMTSALSAGNVLSLLREHIGCPDKVKAELAWTPRLADPVSCALLLPNAPYEVLAQEGRGGGMSMVQVKNFATQHVFWVMLSTQALGG